MTRRASTKSQSAEMNAVANGSASQLERINALLKWWGAPVIDFSTNEAQLRSLQEFTDGIQNLYRDVSNRERCLFEETSRDLNARIANLARPRKPSELLGTQSVMAAKLLDGMSHHSRLWIDMAEGFIDHYAAFAKRAAALSHRQRDGSEKTVS